jgi:hypothetical protein
MFAICGFIDRSAAGPIDLIVDACRRISSGDMDAMRSAPSRNLSPDKAEDDEEDEDEYDDDDDDDASYDMLTILTDMDFLATREYTSCR